MKYKCKICGTVNQISDNQDVSEVVCHSCRHVNHICTQVNNNQNVSEVGAAIGGGILLASLGGGPIGAVIGAILGAVLASSTKRGKNDTDT